MKKLLPIENRPTPVSLHGYFLLLALSNRPLHSYGLAQQVVIDSSGAINPSTGRYTIYWYGLQKLVWWRLAGLFYRSVRRICASSTD